MISPRIRVQAAALACLSVGASTLGLSVQAKPLTKRTLRFTWWGGSDRHARTLKAIAAFELANPGVKIKPEYMGNTGYMEKLTMQMVSGTEPDIMQIAWASLAMFSKNGDGFYNLNLQRQHLSLEQFSPEDLAETTVNGKLNGLTASFTARILLWNRAAFDRAGLALPATWDDLFDSGRVFKERLGPKAFPIDGEPYDMLLLSHAYAYQLHGSPYVHPTLSRVAMTPAAILDWVKAFNWLTNSGTATPLPYRASLGGADKPLEQQQDWVVGNWAGNYTWDATIRLRAATLNASQKLEVGAFPMLKGATKSGIFGRSSMLFAVSKHSAHPEIAARFLNFMLTSEEAARILSLTRGVPAASGALRALERDRLLPPLESKAFRQIKAHRDAGNIERPSPRFEDARFRRFLRDVFESLAYKKINETEAAARLLDEGNTLLTRIK